LLFIIFSVLLYSSFSFFLSTYLSCWFLLPFLLFSFIFCFFYLYFSFFNLSSSASLLCFSFLFIFSVFLIGSSFRSVSLSSYTTKKDVRYRSLYRLFSLHNAGNHDHISRHASFLLWHGYTSCSMAYGVRRPVDRGIKNQNILPNGIVI
jgi:hypothetical protein